MNCKSTLSISIRRLLAFGGFLLLGAFAFADDGPKDSPREQRLIVRVEPVELGNRERDELPAEVVIDNTNKALDATSLRVVRVDESGRPISNEPLPFRWYDAVVPYDFPEFLDSVSRTEGKLKPEPRERGGVYLNAMGDGRKGRLAWMHTQISNESSWYAVEFNWLKPNAVPKQLPPQGWIGDGMARCAELATQAVHSDHLRIDLDDWNGDGLIDLIVGDDFGHLVWWPNLGTKQSPKFEYTRLILDADGVPIDVGTLAAPKVCDWDGDGDRDLVIGTYRNKIVWFENIGTDRERQLKYRGFVTLDGQPLELPVKPLTRGEPAIFNLDYYPVLEFVDWDGDGDNDLLAGGYITGCVFLYENTGSERGSPPKLVARGPLEVEGKPLNVGHWCAAPCVVDIDGDGDLDLLSGHTPMREPGMKAGIRWFENIGSRTTPKLKSGDLKAEHLWSITLGSPRAFDWDDDGDLDLVISVRTHILLLENAGSNTSPKFDKPPVSILPKWGPAPVHADQLLDWNGDGRVDLVSNYTVRLNDGTKNPWSWTKSINVLPPGVTIEHKSGRGDEEHSTFLNDFDDDGAIDVLFGDWFGHVWLHRNRGTAEKPDFDLTGLKLPTIDGTPIKVGPIGLDPDKDFNSLQGARTVVTAGDFDGDKRQDLIVGDTFGKVRFFRQMPDEMRLSKESPVFAPAIEIGDLGIRLNVCATDWNQDGRLDVIAGSANGKVQVFLSSTDRDAATPFAAGFTPKLPPIMQPRVLLGDLNGDGDDDLYFPSTQGTCFVERSFLNHGYARGVVVSEPSGVTAEPLLKLATFRVDVTPPIGDGPCVGCMPKVSSIEHPLELRGIVLRSDSRMFVIASIDYCGLCNSSDETIRDAMARAAGTTRERVALQSLHQHSAPILDAEAVRFLHGEKSEPLAQHLRFTNDIASRTAAAIEASLQKTQTVTRIVGSKAKVDRVASNRRVPQPDGSIAVRASFTREVAVREAPEGLIDPWMRTLTFFDGEQRLVQLHYYATHPQTFYGDARVSWDSVGMARERFEKESRTFQIYFTGCGGNVTVGKYNDGTRDAREQLAVRLLEAMRRSGRVAPQLGGESPSDSATTRMDTSNLKPTDIAWDSAPIKFTVREDGAFNPELLRKQLAPDQPFPTRLTAAMFSGFGQRLRDGYVAQATRLRIGDIDIVHLPGEPFVEFQLFAQEVARANSFTCVAGYGECGVWYYGPDRIFTDRGGYEQTWSLTGPCEQTVKTTLTRLLEK